MKVEYFSQRTIDVLRNAQKKATELKFEDVGTDHLLLAIADDTDLFERIGYNSSIIQREVSMLIGESDAEAEALRYTQRAKHVIEQSIQNIATSMNTSVEPEHLLLSLVKESGGVALRALENLNIDITDFQTRVELVISA